MQFWQRGRKRREEEGRNCSGLRRRQLASFATSLIDVPASAEEEGSDKEDPGSKKLAVDMDLLQRTLIQLVKHGKSAEPKIVASVEEGKVTGTVERDASSTLSVEETVNALVQMSKNGIVGSKFSTFLKCWLGPLRSERIERVSGNLYRKLRKGPIDEADQARYDHVSVIVGKAEMAKMLSSYNKLAADAIEKANEEAAAKNEDNGDVEEEESGANQEIPDSDDPAPPAPLPKVIPLDEAEEAAAAAAESKGKGKKGKAAQADVDGEAVSLSLADFIARVLSGLNAASQDVEAEGESASGTTASVPEKTEIGEGAFSASLSLLGTVVRSTCWPLQKMPHLLRSLSLSHRRLFLTRLRLS